ncbi:hypothetical protein [Bradyrhizobium liaoningense]|uniref:hypothetical protein n=1 Tax=Bradyrhizobium liaoningense TaxID=43992 RepID=UPI001BAB320C|nr:hypothetical protein [Bradyrhizobium liaoningense]
MHEPGSAEAAQLGKPAVVRAEALLDRLSDGRATLAKIFVDAGDLGRRKLPPLSLDGLVDGGLNKAAEDVDDVAAALGDYWFARQADTEQHSECRQRSTHSLSP